MQTKQQQNIVAISETAKQWIADTCDTFSAPSKSREDLPATQKETVEALIEFVDANRYQKRPVIDPETGEDTGDTEEYDAFEATLNAVMARRMDTVRVSTAAKELAAANAKLAELEAKLAAAGLA